MKFPKNETLQEHSSKWNVGPNENLKGSSFRLRYTRWSQHQTAAIGTFSDLVWNFICLYNG
jgi:hypothetical protein